MIVRLTSLVGLPVYRDIPIMRPDLIAEYIRVIRTQGLAIVPRDPRPAGRIVTDNRLGIWRDEPWSLPAGDAEWLGRR